MSHGSAYRTKLGDVVRVRFDDDGNEHITVHVPVSDAILELLPGPSGLDNLVKYQTVTTNRRNRP